MKIKQLLTATLIFGGVSAFGQGTLDTGLIRNYPFNGNADDATSNAANGTVDGAMLTVDRFGDSTGAYYFDGVDDKITFSATGCDNPAFSFSIWANIHWDSSLNNGIGAYGMMYIGNASQNDHGITTGAGGVQWTVGTYHTDATLSNILSGIQPTAGVWHHLVFTRDADSIKLYLNGNQIGSVSPNGKAAGWNGSLEGVIGARPGPSSTYMFNFRGSLDDVRVYDRVLTSSEVSDLFNWSPTTNFAPVAKIDATIFPNPAKSGSMLNIHSNEDLSGATVLLYSGNGQLVLSAPYSSTLQLPQLSQGVYILRVQGAEGVTTQKLIIEE